MQCSSGPRLGIGLFVAGLVAGVAPIDAPAAGPAKPTVSFCGAALSATVGIGTRVARDHGSAGSVNFPRGGHQVCIGPDRPTGLESDAAVVAVVRTEVEPEDPRPDPIGPTPSSTAPPAGRGARLLAVIATICVFGVTTAIIRAIVAQRTTRSAATSQHE